MYTYLGLDSKNNAVLVIDNNTLQFSAVTKDQFVNALKSNAVINVGFKDGKIVGTNGALGNYGLLGEKNVPVVVKVGTIRNAKRGRDEAFEYIISSTDGKIVKYNREQAIALFKKHGVANGRLVIKEGVAPYVSAIRTKYESYSIDCNSTESKNTVKEVNNVKAICVDFSAEKDTRSEDTVFNIGSGYLTSKNKDYTNRYKSNIGLSTCTSLKKGTLIDGITIEKYIPIRVGDLDGVDEIFKTLISRYSRSVYAREIYTNSESKLYKTIEYSYVNLIKKALLEKDYITNLFDIGGIKSSLVCEDRYEVILPATLDWDTRNERDIKDVFEDFKKGWCMFKLVYTLPLKNEISANDYNIKKLLDIVINANFSSIDFIGGKRPKNYLTHSEMLNYVSNRLANYYNMPNTITNKGIKVNKNLKNYTGLLDGPLTTILNFDIAGDSGIISKIDFNCRAKTSLSLYSMFSTKMIYRGESRGQICINEDCDDYKKYLNAMCSALPFNPNKLKTEFYYEYADEHVYFLVRDYELLNRQECFYCTKEGLNALLKYYIED